MPKKGGVGEIVPRDSLSSRFIILAAFCASMAGVFLEFLRFYPCGSFLPFIQFLFASPSFFDSF